MRKFARLTWIGLLAIGLFGCGQKGADAANQDMAGSGLKAVSTDGNNAAGTKIDTKTPAGSEANNEAGVTKPQVPSLDLSKIPATLRGDAFEYYGLGRTEPIKMTVTQSGKSDPATQTVKLTKVDAEKAEFTISNDGGLAKLGEVIVSLDKNGIKVVSVNGQKADAETFELPNGLSKGKKWPFKLENGDLKLTGTNVVSGTESVTTAVGTYKDALLVVSTSTGKQGKETVQLKSKQWLVKGRGQIKAEITNVSGKTTQTVTMAESK
jgi:hypothetical protein